jgi:RND family efflux transporter MFP subunit
MKTTILRILLPLLILAGGAGISRWVAQQAPNAERRQAEKPAPLVEVQVLVAAERRARIEATGLVTPAQQIVLIPQVTGQVVHLSPSMVPGGHVKKGELLVRIDARDYKLAVEQHRGNLRSAALEVEREKAQQELALHEWQVLGEQGAPSPLFSRESQTAAAEANLGSGQRSLDRAELSLSRTTLRAPFDATVVSENVDLGQVVGPQSQLAQLIGTGEMWVMVSVPVGELELLQIPGVNAEQGSTAEVRQRLTNGRAIVRQGEVTRLVSQLDDRTRRAQLVVTISEPLDTQQGLPLLAGAHVQVAVDGKTFERVFAIPRRALYEGNRVWLMQADGTLSTREVSVAWGETDHVYVTAGVAADDQLVLTRLSAPIVGMKVTKAPSTQAASGAPAPAKIAAQPGAPTEPGAATEREVN